MLIPENNAIQFIANSLAGDISLYYRFQESASAPTYDQHSDQFNPLVGLSGFFVVQKVRWVKVITFISFSGTILILMLPDSRYWSSFVSRILRH